MRREFLHGQVGERRDRSTAKQHVTGHRVEPLAGALRTGDAAAVNRFPPLRFFAALLRVELLHFQTSAEASLAPAMARVEREQPRIEFGKARAAVRAGALGGKYRFGLGPRHMHDAAAMLQRHRQCIAQLAFARGADRQGGNGQFDVVLDESVQSRPFRGGNQLGIDPQLCVSLAARPFGERGVQSLARHDERRQQRHLLTAIFLEKPCRDRLHRLRFDGGVADRAVLHAQLHVHQAQKMIDLGQRGDGALVTAAAGALLDGDRGRYAENGIDIGTRGRLHELRA